MIYSNPNTGLLSPEMVKTGDRIKIIDEAFSREVGTNIFWNVKVELENGSHKLASIIGNTGDEFTLAWGSDTLGWIGRYATVEVKESKAGKSYIVMNPAEDVVGQKIESDGSVKLEDLPF